MKAEGRPIEIIQVDSSFAVGDIQHSTVKDFGAFYLFEMLAEQMGLLSVLRKSLTFTDK
jgi:hypothetical protein